MQGRQGRQRHRADHLTRLTGLTGPTVLTYDLIEISPKMGKISIIS